MEKINIFNLIKHYKTNILIIQLLHSFPIRFPRYPCPEPCPISSGQRSHRYRVVDYIKENIDRLSHTLHHHSINPYPPHDHFFEYAFFMNTSAATPIKTAIIWARTSSSGALETRQSTTRQVEDLQDFASRNRFKVEKVFEEHISGRTKYEHREVLSSAIDYAKENHINTILTTELSRIGRSDDVLFIVRECKEAGINIYFQKENLNIFQPDGKPNPFLNIFISCLSFAASSELEAIQSRLRSGREKYVREGGRLGKPKGSGVKTKDMLSTEYRSVIRNLKSGQSVRNTAKITGVSQSTVQRVKKTFGI